MIQLSKRTVICALVAFTVVAGLATASFVRTLAPADAANFKDTPPWAAKQINWLADNEIAGGYDDNTFRPDLNITRAQAAYWFSNYNDTLVRRGTVVTPTEDSSFAVEVPCPPDTRAIAGGGGTDQDNMYMTDSLALTSPEAWGLRWETENDALVTPEIFAYALCAPDALAEAAAESLATRPEIEKP